jgi:hypothetical protein
MIISSYYPINSHYVVGTAYHDPTMGKSLTNIAPSLPDARDMQQGQVLSLSQYYLAALITEASTAPLGSDLKLLVAEASTYAALKQHLALYADKYATLAKKVSDDSMWSNRIDHIVAYYHAY